MCSEPAGPSPAPPTRTSRFPTLGRCFGNLGWPLLLKQLRTEVRRGRYFWAYFCCLTLLAGSLLWQISSAITQDPDVTAPQVGEGLFGWFLAIQVLVVIGVFPLFSATAFTEERSALSLDALLITRLTPEEIVWGKLLASTLHCALYVIATVPLLSISFLFGGVRIVDVLAAYALIISLTAIVSMGSLCVSAHLRRNLAATLAVYAPLLIAALLAYRMLVDAAGVGEETGAADLGLRLLRGAMDAGGGLAALRILLDVAAVLALLFLLTGNRLRPPAQNRTSAIRALILVWFPLRLLVSLHADLAALPPVEELVEPARWIESRMRSQITTLAILLLPVVLVATTGAPAVSERVRRQVARWSSWRFPARVLAPGPFWGLACSVLLSSALCGELWWLYQRAYHHPGLVDAETTELVRESLTFLPLYLAGVGALGFLLAATDFSPLHARLTVIFLLIISSLLPKILQISEEPDAIWCGYYLSPLVIWESLGRSPGRVFAEAVQYRLWGAPIVVVGKVCFAALATVATSVAVGFTVRAGHPLLRYGSPPGEGRSGPGASAS